MVPENKSGGKIALYKIAKNVVETGEIGDNYLTETSEAESIIGFDIVTDRGIAAVTW